MNILLLNPNYINRHNWGHQLFKNELVNHHNVVYYGNGYPNYNSSLNIRQIIKRYAKNTDLILTYEAKYTGHINGLDSIDIPKAHIQIDYSKATRKWSGAAKKENVERFLKNNNYDLIFVTSTSNQRMLSDSLNTDKVFVLPFSVDINKYKNLHLSKIYDVMATFTNRPDVYPERRKIQQLINKMSIKSFSGRAIHEAYIKKINESRIFIISNNFNNRLSMKYTEALACRTFVLTDKPEDFEFQGFINKKHLVLYKDLNDLKKKILYYISHEQERESIAKNGMKFVRRNHSCSQRVIEFTDIVKKELSL